jgi:hypothetical protein
MKALVLVSLMVAVLLWVGLLVMVAGARSLTTPLLDEGLAPEFPRHGPLQIDPPIPTLPLKPKGARLGL